MQVTTTSSSQSLTTGLHFSEASSRLARNGRGLLSILGIASLLMISAPALAQTLGAAQSFAIVGESIAANGSGSTADGNIGALAAITGVPGNLVISSPFINHGGDAVTIAARADLLALYNSAVMAPASATPIGGDSLSLGHGGLSSAVGHYTPGTYTNAGGATIMPTSITLDGAGTYVFTLANSLTTDVSATVILNGVDPCSVFWRVPTQATLNGLTFPGTVVSDGIIALGVGVNVTGRTLTTANGAVTLAGTDRIGGCSVPEQGVAPYLAATTLSRATPLPSGTVGTPMTDTKTLIGGGLGSAAPTGTITFNLYAPNDTACDGSAIFTSTVPVNNGNGTYTSAPYTPSAVGTYRWIANYSGDTNNAAAANTCGDATESVVVTAAAVTAVTAIPTLSEWAMIMLAALLAIVGFVGMRRRAR